MNLSALRALGAAVGGERFLVHRNLVFSGALQASTYILGFVTVPYLTRTLGPSHYGALAFSMSLNAYGWMVVDWGFSTGATREVATHREDPVRLRSIFWTVMSAKALLVIVAAITLGAFTLTNRSPSANITLLPVLITVVGSLLSVDWFVQGFEKMGTFAATTIGGRALSFILLFFLVHRPDDVWIAAILQASSSVVGALGGLLVVRRLVSLGRANLSVKAGLAKLSQNRHYFLINSNGLLYISAAPLVLNVLSGSAAVGFFAAADKLLKVVFAAMTPIATVMYPRTVSLIRINPKVAARTAGRSFLIQSSIGLALGAVILFGSDLLTGTLLGRSMAPAAQVLRCLALAPTIGAFNRVLTSQMLYPLGLAQETARAVYTTAPIYLIGLVGLSWRFGPVGAAAAFSLTEAIQAVLFALILWQRERPYLLDACAGLDPFRRD